MFFLFHYFGTLDFVTGHDGIVGMTEAAPGLLALATPTLITTLLLMLFLGCTGKSAQFPLYTWLPDAMEGPTPVSALIHAATMVTAGVYLVSRTHALFVLSDAAMITIAVTGIATAFFAATIGLMQNDIKRVLAYSTVSQLGYMFAACGAGVFAAGMFHVMTHAFFKACPLPRLRLCHPRRGTCYARFARASGRAGCRSRRARRLGGRADRRHGGTGPERPAGHAEHGRFAGQNPRDGRVYDRGDGRDLRHLAVCGLLQQRRNSLAGLADDGPAAMCCSGESASSRHC